MDERYNVSPETIKLLEKIGRTLDINCSNIYFFKNCILRQKKQSKNKQMGPN